MPKSDMPTMHEFTGLAGQLKDSRFLSADSLPQGEKVNGEWTAVDVTVEIETVYKAEDFDMYRGPTEKEHVDVACFLKFKDKAKLYKCSETNRKTLVRLFGNNAGNWKGKKIVMFVDHKKAFGDPDFPWIRFRNKDINAPSVQRNARAAKAEQDRPDVPYESGAAAV